MTEPAEGPGDALREAREALDVSTREVADALNLPMSVIEALEANDYERLPQPVFTRGYLRSYARLLELDPAAIVARYPAGAEDTFASGELEAVSETATTPSVDSRLALGVGALAVVLLVALLLVWLWPEDEAGEIGSAPTPPPAAEVEARPSPGIEGEAAVTSAQGRADAAPLEELEARQPAIEASPSPAAAAAREPAAEAASSEAPREPARPETEPSRADEVALAEEEPSTAQGRTATAPEARLLPEAGSLREVQPELSAPTPAGFRRITPFGDDELVLTFSEDCWVEVKDLDGGNLYSDLNRAGRTLRLVGAAPFRLLLGYAPGVTLELNGEAVELSRFTRNNVASLVVGR